MAITSASFENPRRTTEVTYADSPFSDLRTGDTLVCDTVGGEVILNLPLRVRSGSQEIVVTNIGSGSNVRVRRRSTDTIDGVTYVLVPPGDTVRIIKTTSEWITL
jgi:hypothetical protein